MSEPDTCSITQFAYISVVINPTLPMMDGEQAQIPSKTKGFLLTINMP